MRWLPRLGTSLDSFQDLHLESPPFSALILLRGYSQFSPFIQGVLRRYRALAARNGLREKHLRTRDINAPHSAIGSLQIDPTRLGVGRTHHSSTERTWGTSCGKQGKQ